MREGFNFVATVVGATLASTVVAAKAVQPERFSCINCPFLTFHISAEEDSNEVAAFMTISLFFQTSHGTSNHKIVHIERFRTCSKGRLTISLFCLACH